MNRASKQSAAPLGVRNTRNGLWWICLLSFYTAVIGWLYVALGGGRLGLAAAVCEVPVTTVFLTFSGRILSAKRLAGAALLPFAVCAAVLTAACPVLATVYLARLFHSYASAGVREAYEKRGWGAGMAEFVAMTSWKGEFTDAYFAQPEADPAEFGMPTEDDGSRDDPLLSDRSWSDSSYRPDVDAIAAAPPRVVIAVGEESKDVLTGRTSVATAELLGQQVSVFPSHHGGFLDGEFGYAGKPDEFAHRLRQVLDGASQANR